MIDASEYCRKLEAYLCRKNEGHLIRIAGPVFEQVRGWAAQGVPLAVAFRGIDRYCERYYAKGPRRRPVRVEFCEADILELFDDWRRAVGLPSQGSREGARQDRESLPAHMERVTARLTACRGGRRIPTALDEAHRSYHPRARSSSVRVRNTREARIVRSSSPVWRNWTG